MTDVYVITREEGEYSDYSMEIVKVVATEQQANIFVEHENTVQRIICDKHKLISQYMQQFEKDNPAPEPVPYDRTIPVVAYEEKVQNRYKLNQLYVRNLEEAENDYKKIIVEQYYSEYVDKVSTGMEDVRYNYQQMEIED